MTSGLPRYKNTHIAAKNSGTGALMQAMPSESYFKKQSSMVRWTVVSVLRSVASTTVIILIATGIFVFRQGYFSPRMLWAVTVENAPLFVGIFFALMVWYFVTKPHAQR